MEIKINKEIREFTEKIFWGLSLKQLIWAVVAGGVSIATWRLVPAHHNVEIKSIICIITSSPFIAFGFFRFNNMDFGSLMRAVLKFLVTSRPLPYMPSNLYFNLTERKDSPK